MTEIRVYVEGGGDGKDTKAAFRAGFSRFLNRGLPRNVRIIACGSRNSALADFATALRSHPEAICLLLVDGEGPVEHEPWEHLAARDRWQRPPDAAEEHCHLMVQTVEAWLVADPETLTRFYGQHFQQGALPGRKDVEAVEKADLLTALERATRKTQKGTYHKIHHCAKLLELLDPARVRTRARHCDRLFAALHRLVEEN